MTIYFQALNTFSKEKVPCLIQALTKSKYEVSEKFSTQIRSFTERFEEKKCSSNLVNIFKFQGLKFPKNQRNTNSCFSHALSMAIEESLVGKFEISPWFIHNAVLNTHDAFFSELGSEDYILSKEKTLKVSFEMKSKYSTPLHWTELGTKSSSDHFKRATRSLPFKTMAEANFIGIDRESYRFDDFLSQNIPEKNEENSYYKITDYTLYTRTELTSLKKTLNFFLKKLKEKKNSVVLNLARVPALGFDNQLNFDQKSGSMGHSIYIFGITYNIEDENDSVLWAYDSQFEAPQIVNLNIQDVYQYLTHVHLLKAKTLNKLQ